MDAFAQGFLRACRERGMPTESLIKLASQLSPHIATALQGIDKSAYVPSQALTSPYKPPAPAVKAPKVISPSIKAQIDASNLAARQGGIPLPPGKPTPRLDAGMPPNPAQKDVSYWAAFPKPWDTAKSMLGMGGHAYNTAIGGVADVGSRLMVNPADVDTPTANRLRSPNYLSPGTQAEGRKAYDLFQQLTGGISPPQKPNVPVVNTSGQRHLAATPPQQEPTLGVNPLNNGPKRRQEFMPWQLAADAQGLAASPYLPESQRSRLGAAGGAIQALKYAPLAAAMPGGIAPALGMAAAGTGVNAGVNSVVNSDPVTQALFSDERQALESVDKAKAAVIQGKPVMDVPNLQDVAALQQQAQADPELVTRFTAERDRLSAAAANTQLPPEERQQAAADMVKYSVAVSAIKSGADPVQKAEEIAQNGLDPATSVEVAEREAQQTGAPPEDIFAQIGNMPDWAQYLLWGGLGLGAVGLFSSLFMGGDEDGGGMGGIGLILSLLGLGGAGYAAMQGGLLPNLFGGSASSEPKEVPVDYSNDNGSIMTGPGQMAIGPPDQVQASWNEKMPTNAAGLSGEQVEQLSNLSGWGGGNLAAIAANTPGLRTLMSRYIGNQMAQSGIDPAAVNKLVGSLTPKEISTLSSVVGKATGIPATNLQGLINNYRSVIR